MQANTDPAVAGTPTFLFSDIENSTQRWERHQSEMREALERHDAVLRSAIEKRGGRVFKTVGDAFCAVFPLATDAVSAAVDAQRALGAENFDGVDGLLVRMAVHTGEAHPRDGDYFGPTVNRVARLMSIGYGAQVLVSGTSADLLQGELAAPLSLMDLGVHRLKDLSDGERVYQLVAPDLRLQFPALRSLDSLPNNLPRQLTTFVGREAEERDIASLMDRAPLVTLAGSGGVGKTRCALHAGAAVLDKTSDGVWLVELASLTDGALVGGAVAQALGVAESPGRPILDVLISHLKLKQALLILDNCEHLIDAVATAADAILRACPRVRIIATSRQSLNVDGEQVYRMPSLAVPPASRSTALAPADASAYGAVALFEDRARAVDASFRLDASNVDAVGEICRRLDGVPFALQLAAARVAAFPPRELAKRLDERFRLLTGGSRSSLARQQTMRAMIDWSYDLLDERERAIFRRLSIFSGGFTSASAASVCVDATIDEFDVFDVLASLVDKSMVSPEPGTGGSLRYRLLESTRQYALDKLKELGERESAARAHAGAFVELAEELERDKETMADRGWYALVEPEFENWRAALSWTLDEKADVLLGARLAGALHPLWASVLAGEGPRWVPLAISLAPSDAPSGVLAKLELANSALQAAFLHRAESYAAAARALERYDALGDAFGLTAARDLAGSALILMGRLDEGEVLLRAALEDGRRLKLRRLSGNVLVALGIARDAVGDLDGARAYLREALENFRAIGAERLVTSAANNLSETEFQAGDAERALALSTEALEGHRRWNDVRSCALTLANIAAYSVWLGRFDEARAAAREVIELATEARLEFLVLCALQHLAAILALDRSGSASDAVRAARLLGFVEAQAPKISFVRGYTEQQEYDEMVDALRASLGGDALQAHVVEGAAWDEARALREVALTRDS
ncbi:MAG TPA: adenylate/guanylate cyclase domain-containing protein [Candidatus Tumulicola sp.]